jgi:hypothetical protein
MISLRELALALGGKVSGKTAMCRCPAHDDKTPSLSVTQTAAGKLLCKCHAGCSQEEVVAALKARDLWPELDEPKRKLVHTFEYHYCDPSSGAVRYSKERKEYDDGSKSVFFPAGVGRPGMGRNGSEPLIYGGERIADLAEGQPVFVVEGEKKVHRMRELGATAICGDDAATSKWLPSHAELLRGLDVILWPDSDEPGESYIANAARCLDGHAASLRVVRPFGLPNGSKGLDVCDWQGELAELIEGAEPYVPLPSPQPGRPKALIRLLSYPEMVALPEGEFLVEGVIVRRAKNVLFGLSNAFKSFLAADMGGSVSTGCSYHGMAVKKCTVVYVANEAANAVGRKRIPAWMAAHEISQAERCNIYLVNVGTILPNEASRSNLLAAIRAVVKPGEDFFLIIDVLRGTMTGSDSDDEAAAAWTMAAEILVAEGATILTLTHSPYSDDGRIRGSSHLWGSFEGRLHAEGDKEKRTCVLKVDRFKDHDSSGQWGFKLDEVEVEEHPGEMSLVPRLDGEVKPKGSKQKRRLPASAQNALSALRYALDEVGASAPASNHIPKDVRCVTLDQWRTYFYMRSGLDKQDSKKKAFGRGIEILTAEKLAGAWGDFAWLP